MSSPATSQAGLPRLQRSSGLATITLDRPAHHNRLHIEDLLELQRHFAALQADPEVKAVVLTAAGPSFCSGFHLGSLADGARAAAAGPRLFERTVDALEALSMPTVCRLNGSVYGGATDLALACDLRIGVDTMVLRMPAVRLGLHYYPSGLRRFVTRLGLGAAKRLFMLAQDVPADELLRIGYLDRCVGATALDEAVKEIVAALAAAAPLALRGMKSSLDEIARGEYDLVRLRERETLCAGSEDLREGQAALAEKRTPRFQGR